MQKIDNKILFPKAGGPSDSTSLASLPAATASQVIDVKLPGTGLAGLNIPSRPNLANNLANGAAPSLDSSLLAKLSAGGELSSEMLQKLCFAKGQENTSAPLSALETARAGFRALASTFKDSGNMGALRSLEAASFVSEIDRATFLQPGIPNHRRALTT